MGARVEESIVPLLENGPQTLLVGAHHGSKYSNGEEFLDALRPKFAVFSCGRDNPFGFPAPEALERCALRKIPVYRTDLLGAVHAVSDGQTWTITTEAVRDSHANLSFRRSLR
jgi:competence protein ComEC